jgi:hypothetical protein
MLGDLDDQQRAAALAAVRSVLSAAGYTQVEGILAADDYLGSQQGSGGDTASFGAANYYLAFYGEPSADQPWTLQFGGHHLAVHVSLGGEALSVSPHFVGVEPVSFTAGDREYAPMADDARDMFGLFGSLDETRRANAQLAGSYDDLVMGPGVDTGYPAAEGLAYTDLAPEQQQTVQRVIADWVADAAPEISQPLLDLYTSQLTETRIGWSGSTDPDQAAYFRIDGPRVWIEWINTPNRDTEGIHYHTLYRDKQIDYGTGLGG